MNRHGMERRCQVFSALMEGVSVRGTVRLTGVSKPTILKWVEQYGRAAEAFLDDVMRELPCNRIQVDEIWCFCYARKKNVPAELAGRLGYGDVWTWIALCPDTKVVVCWRVGARDQETATQFMLDLAPRLAYPVHLSSDGLAAYRDAVAAAFGLGRVHFTQTVKEFEKEHVRGRVVYGPGDPEYASTSLIESFNRILRQQLKRYARLTPGHSKKLESHENQLALFFLHYNFVRPHYSLRGRTPAQMVGLTRAPWSLPEMLATLEDSDGQI